MFANQFISMFITNNLVGNLDPRWNSHDGDTDEIYQLHNWRSKNVIVKDKGRSVSQLVTETILTLRTLLINKKVQELSKSGDMDDKNFNKDTLEEIVNYYQLKSLLSKKLNRVV